MCLRTLHCRPPSQQPTTDCGQAWYLYVTGVWVQDVSHQGFNICWSNDVGLRHGWRTSWRRRCQKAPPHRCPRRLTEKAVRDSCYDPEPMSGGWILAHATVYKHAVVAGSTHNPAPAGQTVPQPVWIPVLGTLPFTCEHVGANPRCHRSSGTHSWHSALPFVNSGHLSLQHRTPH